MRFPGSLLVAVGIVVAGNLQSLIARRTVPLAVLLIALAIGTGCSDGTLANQGVPRGVWGSAQARLAITDSTAVLQVLGGSSCYGARADAGQPIPESSFTVVATYTQFMGAYPGYVQQSARLSGSLVDNRLSVSIIAIGSGQMLAGPFDLSYGVNPQWSQCLYP
jgi:hypothetical protein